MSLVPPNMKDGTLHQAGRRNYFYIMDLIGLKDSSRKLQTNCIVSYFLIYI